MKRSEGSKSSANGNGKDHRFKALATDGDGTLLTHKQMARGTAAALERLRKSGRKLLLVTGEHPEQIERLPHIDLFDLVVGENGAILYWPKKQHVRLLGKPPPAAFVRLLQRWKVEPLSVGRVIVGSCRPQEASLHEAIRELDLDWQIVFNRDEVMALPRGVNKATGLNAALKEWSLSPAEVVGIGDAENDLALVRSCGLGVAVASAVPVLKEHVDVVTKGGSGKGVVELIDKLIQDSLPMLPHQKSRWT